ncbi:MULTISPECIES: TetR family transcriptional regulator [Mycolicibacterium]|uniref:TetR family transcriptional regulator n=1 Tax=Mycolicibacterium wolinskyi TaxID=59750 RepID=A0A1X2F8B5_9MYCO|nr:MULTISPECIES: TetR family transcriptional regulator [Mycolicibacterium]MCV7286636.1 TetR family transcriptional regulator [Mycolicibacterium wolinskyi]MCV7293616.1 TetR family transcriptional regulator [Mycolicibacterium goodii]ORX14656.1 TetR family transcriptional regulator [Mycolicibacterium wolinskyi]
MSSSAVTTVTRLRDAHAQRTHTYQRVFGAAAQLLDTQSDVSVPALAARAKMAPATLCAHFPTVEVVFAELYLHRLSVLPLVIDPAANHATRVSEQLSAITLLLADEPRLARACTEALVRSDDDAVADVRSRIVAEVRRRISTALGAGAWPEVLATLESVFWGALLQAQTGAMSYRQMARQLETMVALIVPEA